MLLGARHVPERLWRGRVYYGALQVLDLFTFICLPEVLNFVSCVYADQFAIIKHCVKIVGPQHTNMLWNMHASDAISQWLRQWRVVKCCSAKRSNDI